MSGYRIFVRFAAMSGADINKARLSESLLLRFIAYCHAVRKVQHTTIRSYLAAIRFVRLASGFHDPFLDSKGKPRAKIELAVRATGRMQIIRRRQRRPITNQILKQMCTVLKRGVFNPYIDSLMHAICCTAFAGFFRSGEICPDRFDARKNITLEDVHIHNLSGTIHLKTSKTDRYNKGIDVRLFANSSNICPIKSIRHFHMMRGEKRSNAAFFCLPSGEPLTRRTFIENMRHVLRLIGFDADKYSGHSLRIGAATSAARAGVPDHVIKILGRWNSLSYLRYIRVSNSVIKNAQNKYIR